MTLLSPRRDPGRPAAGSGKAARRGPTAPPETVQTPLAAGIGAALWSAAFGLGLSVAAVLATWAISGRAAGHPRGAIVAGAQAWLLGNGTDLRLERGTLTLMPLGLTLLLVLLLARSGVWAGRAAMVQTLREAAVATACLVTVYVGIAVTLALLARSPDVTPVVPTALTGALAVSLLAGGAGVLHGSGLLGALLEPLPRQARLALRGAAGGLVALVAGGSVVFVASLAWHAQDAARLYSSLGADLAGSIELIGLCLAYAPVGVLWAMAYCLGPGFAVGTGTLVSPSGTTLGDLPAFPLLAALPGEGPAPALAVLGLAVPIVAGVVIGVRVARWSTDGVGPTAAIAAGSGALTGVLAGLLTVIARGGLTAGRMSSLGPQPLVVALWTALSLAVVAALAAGELRRRAVGRSPEVVVLPVAEPVAEPAGQATEVLELPVPSAEEESGASEAGPPAEDR